MLFIVKLFTGGGVGCLLLLFLTTPHSSVTQGEYIPLESWLILTVCIASTQILASYSAILLLSEILVAPESRTVFLDQSAEFTCETVGGNLVWVVDGTQRGVHSDDVRSDLGVLEIDTDGGTTLGTLTIPARTDYNGTRVQCAVLTLDGSVQSENATMTIQGIH